MEEVSRWRKVGMSDGGGGVLKGMGVGEGGRVSLVLAVGDVVASVETPCLFGFV